MVKGLPKPQGNAIQNHIPEPSAFVKPISPFLNESESKKY